MSGHATTWVSLAATATLIGACAIKSGKAEDDDDGKSATSGQGGGGGEDFDPTGSGGAGGITDVLLISSPAKRAVEQHFQPNPELEKRLEDINAQLDVPITININGCPNSCARIQIADIGFKGQMVEDGNGGHTEGFQVHLGGSLGLDSGFGRKLRQHKVLSTELGDYIDRVVRNFVKQREQGERFATWALRADEADLR